MEMLEYKVDKVLRYLEAFCPKLNIDLSTIAGLNDPPPVHRSASPSVCSLSSPGLGVSSLALSDTHSNTSNACVSGRPGQTNMQINISLYYCMN